MLAALPVETVEAKPVVRPQQLRELPPLQNDADDVLENAPARSTAPQLNVGRYRHHLADYQLTDAQAEEFLGTLWNIILACIDLEMNLDVEAVLTGSSPLEKTTSTEELGAELIAPKKPSRFAISESGPAEKDRDGQ
jgi:hypothetical protein